MLKEKLTTRKGLTLVTWGVGLIIILALLLGVGSISEFAFLWATVGSTFICKPFSLYRSWYSVNMCPCDTLCEICRHGEVSS